MEDEKVICRICQKNICGKGYNICWTCNKDGRDSLKEKTETKLEPPKPEFKPAKEMPKNIDIQTNRSYFLRYATDLLVSGRLQKSEVQNFLESCEKYLQTGIFDKGE